MVQSIEASAGFVLTDAEATDARRELFTGLEKWARLSAHASTVLGRLLFHVVNKHHFAAHIAIQARWLNPEVSWTYQYEDLMGKVKRVAAAARDGTPRVLIGRKVAERYRVVFAFEMGT
jgi:hypothetical protein